MIGARLADLRDWNNQTQEELAKALNVATSTIRSWEHEKSSPNHEMLIAICRYYGTSADYLLGLTDIDPSDEARKQRQRLTEEEQNEMHRYEEYLLWKRKNKPPSETVRSLGGCFCYINISFYLKWSESSVHLSSRLHDYIFPHVHMHLALSQSQMIAPMCTPFYHLIHRQKTM